MKTVLMRGTGRHNGIGEEIAEPTFLKNTNGLSIFKNGDIANGLDIRHNALGDSADNGMGYQRAIDTLTYIKKQVVEQKFYDVDVGAFIPLALGEGQFAQDILTSRSYTISGDFEGGNIRTAASNSRLVAADVSVDSKTVPIVDWAVAIEYNLMDIEKALVSNNWDLVMGKQISRKKMYDLGIQLIAFLGSRTNTNVPGLLNNTGITVNTSFITAPINSLNAANFAAFVAGLIELYFANTNSTAMPTHFVIPYADFLGLGTPTPVTGGSFLMPMLHYLLDAFKLVTQNPNFKIIPLAYCDAANNNLYRGINKNIYALYRYDMDSGRMDIPCPYTTTQPGTQNNFQFMDVAYSQYTGFGVYRNLEFLQFQY